MQNTRWMKKIAALVAAIACYSATVLSSANAQEIYGALDLPMLGQSLTMSAAIRAQAQRDAARLRGRSPRGHKRRSIANTRRGSTHQGSTRFPVSLAARKRNLAQFVAKVRKTSPTEAASLQQSFANGDPIAAIAPGLRRYKLRTDDVADAATAYLVAAWYGVRGRNDDPPLSYVSGVQTQMKSTLLSMPAFRSASNSTKQQMAEALLVQTMVADALITSAKGNPSLMQKVKAAIEQGARSSFQLDLTQLKLTSQGFKV